MISNRFFFVLLLSFFIFSTSNAQSFFNQNLELILSTESPEPNEIVEATIEAPGVNMAHATVSWYINNELVKQGIGLTTFSFKVGKLGEETSLIVLVNTQDGKVLNSAKKFKPGSVELVFEASSYVPPFYKGKALYPYQGIVRVHAIPNILDKNGDRIDPKNLVYRWKHNNKVDTNYSGYGKSVFAFKGDVLIRPSKVEVEVSNSDGTYSVLGRINIAPTSPQIGLYENNPLYGLLLNKSLSNTTNLKSQEMQISAIPYFFGVKDKENIDLVYNWSLNGNSLNQNGKKSVLSVTKNKDSSGESIVGIEISNTNMSSIYQSANTQTKITY